MLGAFVSPGRTNRNFDEAVFITTADLPFMAMNVVGSWDRRDTTVIGASVVGASVVVTSVVVTSVVVTSVVVTSVVVTSVVVTSVVGASVICTSTSVIGTSVVVSSSAREYTTDDCSGGNGR